MSLVYGDNVVLVKKSPDGTIRRVNAIVLASSMHVPRTVDHKAIPDAALEEHLDLMFPRIMPDGHAPKSRAAEDIFQPAYDQRPWQDGLWSGWQPGCVTPVAPAPAPPAPPKPTAADLDAVVAEKSAADATTGT